MPTRPPIPRDPGPVGPHKLPISRDPGPLGPPKLGPKKYEGRTGGGVRGGNADGNGRKRNGGGKGGGGNPALHHLKYQLGLANTERRRDNQDTRTTYRQAKNDLNFVHQDVKDYLNRLSNKTNAAFRGTVGDLNRNTAALQAQLGTGADANQAAALAEQQRLGIQQSGMGSFGQDAAMMQSLAGQLGQNNQQNLSLSNQGYNEVANLLAGSNMGSWQAGRGQAAIDRNTALTERNRAYWDEANALKEQMAMARMAQRAAARQRSSSGGYSSGGGSGYTPYTNPGTGGEVTISPDDQTLANLLLGPLVGNKSTPEMSGDWFSNFKPPKNAKPYKGPRKGGKGRHPVDTNAVAQNMLYPF